MTDYFNLSTGVPNNIDLVSSPPGSLIPKGNVTVDVVSLELMLYKKKLEYDFEITAVKGVLIKSKLKGRKKYFLLKKALLDYKKLFDLLLLDEATGYSKLNFYVIRMKLDVLLVERMFQDFIKRSKYRLSKLSRLDKPVYYVKQSQFLLKEIDNFSIKKDSAFKHIAEAVDYYRLRSNSEFHVLEKELFSLQERSSFKVLTETLENSLKLLKGKIK